jgi:hypothetical protein
MTRRAELEEQTTRRRITESTVALHEELGSVRKAGRDKGVSACPMSYERLYQNPNAGTPVSEKATPQHTVHTDSSSLTPL